MAILIAIIISLIAGVVVMESYAWLPKISKWLVERAAKKFSEEDRARLTEEWHALLDNYPGSIGCVVHAISIYISAIFMLGEHVQSYFVELDRELNILESRKCELIKGLDEGVAELCGKTATLRAQIKVNSGTMIEFIPALTGLKKIRYAEAVGAYERFATVLLNVIDKAENSTKMAVKPAHDRCERLGIEINEIRRDRLAAEKVARVNGLTNVSLPVLLKKLQEDVKKYSANSPTTIGVTTTRLLKSSGAAECCTK